MPHEPQKQVFIFIFLALLLIFAVGSFIYGDKRREMFAQFDNEYKEAMAMNNDPSNPCVSDNLRTKCSGLTTEMCKLKQKWESHNPAQMARAAAFKYLLSYCMWIFTVSWFTLLKASVLITLFICLITIIFCVSPFSRIPFRAIGRIPIGNKKEIKTE